MSYDPLMRWEWEGGALAPPRAAPAPFGRLADGQLRSERQQQKTEPAIARRSEGRERSAEWNASRSLHR